MEAKESIRNEVVSGKKQATHFNEKGLIDKSQEMQELLNDDTHSIEKMLWFKSTGYAAIKDKKSGQIWGMVIETKINENELSYEMIPESQAPNPKDCPLTILNKLTPTDNPKAWQWRQDCFDAYHEHKHKQDLNKLPLGTTISFIHKGDSFILNFHEVKKGQTVELTKKRVGCYKDSAWYMGNIRWTKDIPRDYEISGKKLARSR